MTASELWREYIDSLDGVERRSTLDEFHEMCGDYAATHFDDVVEYVMFLRLGQVASMPEMPTWA